MGFLPAILTAPRAMPESAALAPFLVTDEGQLTTAYENAGVVNVSPTTAGKREISNSIPWSDQQQAPLRKLTHFRAPGMGDPMWSGACVYDLAGGSPSYSQYDQPDVDAKDDGLATRVTGGTTTDWEQIPPGEPTFTRKTRVAAQQSSALASTFFQGFANLHWSGFMVGYVKTPVPSMHKNFNPGQMGSKELHRATQYLPVPPMGSIVGYFGSDAKAL